MTTYTKLLTILIFIIQPAFADDTKILFQGEIYSKIYKVGTPKGDKLIEYIREQDTFKNWTILIAYRYQQLPGTENNPEKTAKGMLKMLKSNKSTIDLNIHINDNINEAQLNFLLADTDMKTLEYNVFRYIKSLDGKAVESLQLAYRFDIKDDDGIAKYKKIRRDWNQEASKFDIDKIRLTE